MTVDKARLRRAKLIERVRSAEQRAAAGEAFRAEAVRRKLEQLSERTRSLAQVYALRDKVNPLIQISEVRSIAADELLMSPCREQDSVAIHFTLRRLLDASRSSQWGEMALSGKPKHLNRLG